MLRLTATNPGRLDVDGRNLLLAIAFDGRAHGHGAVEERERWEEGVTAADHMIEHTPYASVPRCSAEHAACAGATDPADGGDA